MSTLTSTVVATLGLCLGIGQPAQVANEAGVRAQHEDLAIGNLGYVSQRINADASKSATWRCPIDKNSVVYATIFLSGKRSRFAATDAKGASVELVGLDEGDFGENIKMVDFRLDPAPEGELIITLFAGPDEPASLSGSIKFSNGLKLSVEVQPDTISKPRSCAVIKAHLENSKGVIVKGGGKEWTCTIIDADQKTAIIALHDDGLHADGDRNDGVFGALACGDHTGVAGDYDIHVRGLSEIDGSRVRRDVLTVFSVMSDGAGFVGPPSIRPNDRDGDSLVDAIEATYGLEIRDAGEYRIYGQFKDKNGKTIADLTARTGPVQPAQVQLTLSVPGDRIVRNAVEGPWLLTGVTLLKEDANAALVAVAPDVQVIEYTLAAFDPPPPPTILRISPERGPTKGGVEVVITGAGLNGATRVSFGGHDAQFEVRDDLTIVAMLPRSHSLLNSRVSVKIKTPWGSTSSIGGFSYE